MCKFKKGEEVINENNNCFTVVCVTNRSYKLETDKHWIGRYPKIRIFSHECAEARFVNPKKEYFNSRGEICKK